MGFKVYEVDTYSRKILVGSRFSDEQASATLKDIKELERLVSELKREYKEGDNSTELSQSTSKEKSLVKSNLNRGVLVKPIK